MAETPHPTPPAAGPATDEQPYSTEVYQWPTESELRQWRQMADASLRHGPPIPLAMPVLRLISAFGARGKFLEEATDGVCVPFISGFTCGENGSYCSEACRLRAKLAAAEAANAGLRDALQDLCDHQNGPPLPSYEAGWTRAMGNARRLLAAPAPAAGEGTEDAHREE